MRGRLIRLPGGRIATQTAGEWVRAMWWAFWLVPVASARMRRAVRKGSWTRLHQLERRWARAVVGALGIRLEVNGAHRVDPDQRYLVMALHEGFADVVGLLHLPLDLRFLARDELFEWPRLGRHLQETEQILVPDRPSRSDLRRLLEEARRTFERGESLVVFPQGSILGVEVAFQPGVLRLARSFRVPVLPVVLTGSHRVWEHPYSPRLRFGCRMNVRVLDPVWQPSDESLRELERAMKALARDGRMAEPRRFRPERDGYWDGYRYEIDPDYPGLAAQVARHRSRLSR